MRTKFFVLPLLVLLLISLISPVTVKALPGGSSVNPREVGQIGGVTNAVVYSNGQLYFSVGPRIARMAVSAAIPGAPTLPPVYSSILPGIPVDIKVANGAIYVAMGTAGVAVVDATSLAITSNLVPPTTLNGPAYANAVAVGSQRLYVAAGDAGIVAYNLGLDLKTLTYSQTAAFTSPLRMITDVETVTISSGNGTQELLLASANNYAATPANRGGVLKFDISINPVLSTPSSIKGQIDVNAIKANATYVYAVGDSSLYILDLATLGAGGGTFTDFAIPNAASELSLTPNEAQLYLLSVSGIDAVDVTNAGAPTLMTPTPFSVGGVVADLTAVEFPGDAAVYLYMADYNHGLSIASAPQTSEENLTLITAGYVTPKPVLTSAVAGAFRQAFVVSNPSKLFTVNSANPAAMSVVGAGITPPAEISYLTASNGLLLASASTSGLLRYQITPGSQPVAAGTYSTLSDPFGIAVKWPNAYVAVGSSGLEVVNLDGAMSLVGHAGVENTFDSDYHLVTVSGNYAYVVDNSPSDARLRIYDISDPSGPISVGSLAQVGILDVKVSGNFAFLACGAEGVVVVDVLDPTLPVVVAGAGYKTPDSAKSLAVYHNSLYVAGGYAGVHLFHFVPSSGVLSLISTVATSANAVQLALVDNDYLYVADSEGGLVVIRSSEIGPNKIFIPQAQHN